MQPERIREVVRELLRRPGHEKVRSLVYELLVHGLEASSAEIDFEQSLPEVHGRADALLGRTVFEFKRDLRQERGEAESRLRDYMADREAHTGERFVGIVTDGAEFDPYELRDGELVALTRYRPSRDKPRDLLAWLASAVAIRPELPPEPEVIQRELGRESLAYEVSRARLATLWDQVSSHPDVQVKRRLWASLLEVVYGSSVDQDDLFFQHTYLTIVAKTMASRVLGLELPEPSELLAGTAFRNVGVLGAVESDFFDWVLSSDDGEEIVRRIAGQASRFRLQDVRTDVLKGLYESLIDPQQRRYLGEYYTPDWLAAWVCERAVSEPLEQRVVDPACGSGSFLFHLIRTLLAAADSAGLSNAEAIDRCTERILGIDIHPVAVIIARVTYLLALGEERLREPGRPAVSVPVYLGDSLQWNTRQILATREVQIEVPDGPSLWFPAEATADPTLFDSVISRLVQSSKQNAPAEGVERWLHRQGLDQDATSRLLTTYEDLRQLQDEGKNHIWGYVARNLARPMWLSGADQKVDVIVGNPPWLAYRAMSRGMQTKFKNESKRLGVWSGKPAARDLSGYFFARCVELYLRDGGGIAFVLPYAAMSRSQFAGFRTGDYGPPGLRLAQVTFDDAWALDDAVQPLFRVPSSVFFATEGEPGGLPTEVRAYSGELPRRDASPGEATETLTSQLIKWPPILENEAPEQDGSPYREHFRQGAPLTPRMLCLVDLADSSPLGTDPEAPLVTSHRSAQEDRTWKEIPSLSGPVEAEFLRLIYLSRCILPFRVGEPALGVIPWNTADARLMDSQAAQREGHLGLGAWLKQAETLWSKYGQDVPFVEAIDYFKSLSNQLSKLMPIRVVYPEAGALQAAAVVRDPNALIDHDLYWHACAEDEARYLEAVFNSEVLRQRIAEAQSRGQWGARHFSKVVFNLAVPKFDSASPLHVRLAEAAARAEQAAASIELPPSTYFVTARTRVREALREKGVTDEIDRLVDQLLGSR